jgi:hypothetical protein
VSDSPEDRRPVRPAGAPLHGAPLYKGEPLDAERGPGLGCFWIQIVTLGVLLVLTPLTVVWAWDERISAALLIVTLVLLLFAGQTVIFLLRLVAADRRSRRRPLSTSARRTVGQLEDGPTGAADRPVVEPPAARSVDGREEGSPDSEAR